MSEHEYHRDGEVKRYAGGKLVYDKKVGWYFTKDGDTYLVLAYFMSDVRKLIDNYLS